MSPHRESEFEYLYRVHAASVLAYCTRRTSREDAKDATSEIFMIALRKIDQVPKGDDALPWLYTVSANVLRNRSRSARRRTRLAARLQTQPREVVPSPEPIVVRHAEHQELIDALARLPEKDQEVLRLIEWEGLSREQVAKMMYLSRSAIDKRVTRAYRRLNSDLGLKKEAHAADKELRTAPVPIEEGGEV